MADLTILGDPEAIRRRADELGIDLSGATLLDPRTSEHADRFADEYVELRKHKGMTPDVARDRILREQAVTPRTVPQSQIGRAWKRPGSVSCHGATHPARTA